MSERARPGDAILHPTVLSAIVLLVVNDHVLKAAFPGFITGKLSDVAGLIFFPVLVWSALELVVLRRPARFSVCVAVIVVVAAAFTAMKTLEPAADVWRYAIGVLQWPLHGSFAPAQFVCDSTDLIAVPVVAVPLAIARRRSQRQDGAK